MNTKHSFDFLTELSEDEYVSINGGESLWYWVAYGAGAAAREVTDFAIDAYVWLMCNRPFAV
jgi:hypothetical protein